MKDQKEKKKRKTRTRPSSRRERSRRYCSGSKPRPLLLLPLRNQRKPGLGIFLRRFENNRLVYNNNTITPPNSRRQGHFLSSRIALPARVGLHSDRSRLSTFTHMSFYVPPGQQRTLRACMVCSLVQLHNVSEPSYELFLAVSMHTDSFFVKPLC